MRSPIVGEAMAPEPLAQWVVAEFARKVAQTVGVAAPEPVPQRVYQYTSQEALASMISPDAPIASNEYVGYGSRFAHIWATASGFMNDSREVEHGRLLIGRAAKQCTCAPETKELMLSAISEAPGLSVFCASFSAAEDHLGQWRAYGNDGRGCALGFELSELAASINGSGTWVIYCDDESAEGVAWEAALTLVNDLALIVDQKRPTDQSEGFLYDEAVRQSLAELLPSVFVRFKSSAFKDEREFRVIYSDSTAPSALTQGEVPKRWFRTTGSVVPFVKLGFANKGVAPLKEVMLGPAAKGAARKAAVELLLQTCGLPDVAVTESRIPYVPH